MEWVVGGRTEGSYCRDNLEGLTDQSAVPFSQIAVKKSESGAGGGTDVQHGAVLPRGVGMGPRARSKAIQLGEDRPG